MEKSERKKQLRNFKLMIVVAVCILLIVVVVLLICRNHYKAETSTIFILKDGKIATTDVEEFSTQEYKEDELKEYVEKTISQYNAKNGKKAVKEKEFSIKEQQAILSIEYQNSKVFREFYGIDFFVGTIEEALKQGYDFETDFVKVAGTELKPAKKDVALKNQNKKVIILNTDITVDVDGKILFVSNQNTEKIHKNQVKIQNGKSVFAQTEADTSTMTPETTTESESVVEEDELIMEEESTEIEFDFGEEVEPHQTSQAYTYIIYE